MQDAARRLVFGLQPFFTRAVGLVRYTTTQRLGAGVEGSVSRKEYSICFCACVPWVWKESIDGTVCRQLDRGSDGSP